MHMSTIEEVQHEVGWVSMELVMCIEQKQIFDVVLVQPIWNHSLGYNLI